MAENSGFVKKIRGIAKGSFIQFTIFSPYSILINIFYSFTPDRNSKICLCFLYTLIQMLTCNFRNFMNGYGHKNKQKNQIYNKKEGLSDVQGFFYFLPL